MTTDLHEAISQAAEGARQLGTIAQSARRRVVEMEIELEDTRQELGRVRTRDEAREAILRRIVDDNVEAVEDPGTVLFDVRVLLGLDGRDGSAQVEQAVHCG